ncbi:NAD(P)-dependent oxidoreductase [Microbacterium flavum]|uniref:NAD(P)H-binding protein n=1 Tax=Microbacterium flavum TaxID=415216 RepID=A0ABS5XY52_9MICO|nr:NAD(P)H-binding protein [Microbacterium flavum]MBT8799074.1 NAD(P)H-binding protein [Microbacterium flavum]
MSNIAVIGGTGYAGRHIVAEAARRGHTVLSVARKVAAERVPGVTYIEGTLLDVPTLLAELQGVDAVVVAVAPRGEMEGLVRPNIEALASTLADDVRLGVVGGAGGSLVAPGGPRLVDTDFPEAFKAEALEMTGVLEDLQAEQSGRDWFFIHPAGGFGGFNPGERRGTYRDGGDVLVVDENGESFISGEDFAAAVIDEIESPKHPRGRFTVGY